MTIGSTSGLPVTRPSENYRGGMVLFRIWDELI